MESPGSIINVLPPELIRMIADAIEPRDWFSLKMSCKTFSTAMPKTLRQMLQKCAEDAAAKRRTTGLEDRTFCAQRMHQAAWNRYELQHRPRTKLSHLQCNQCGQHKPRSCFVDSQASRSKPNGPDWEFPIGIRWGKHLNRTCIDCGTNDYSTSYSTVGSVLIGGKKSWVCRGCKTIFTFQDHRYGIDWPKEQVCRPIKHWFDRRGLGRTHLYCRSCQPSRFG